MTLLDLDSSSTVTHRTPTELLLTCALVVAPLLYLVADTMYSIRGWDDADAAAFHILGAVCYTFVLVRIAAWATGWLAAATLFAGIAGACGNVAFGFNTMHVSLGAVDLVDSDGVGATLLKTLGLLGPVSFVLGAVVLARLGQRTSAVLVGVAGLIWPVAHIANIGWLAVVDNLLLTAGLVPLAFRGVRTDAST